MLKFISRKYAHSRVTFVGLGNMGYSMASNIMKSGVKVAGFDLDKKAVEKFIKDGGEKYDSIESAVKESDALITMLPNTNTVKQVWDTAYKTAKKGTYFIDSSTISPDDSKAIAKVTKEKGFIPSDSPVTGGVMAAKNGLLTFLIGGEQKDYETVKKYLQPMGKNFIYCGESGNGQISKACNNLCLAITMVGLSESMALGVKMGMDPKVLTEVMMNGSGKCWSLEVYNPVPGILPNAPSGRDYENGFGMELITKDVNIALDCAKNVGLDLELAKKTLDHYSTIKEKGLKSKDFSYVYQYILNNKKI